MKTSLTTLLLLITIGIACISTLSCCKKKPNDKLPPATQEGKNTMGYLIDGEPVFMEGVYKKLIIGCSQGIQLLGGSTSIIIQGKKCEALTLSLNLGKASIKPGIVLLNKTPTLESDDVGELMMIINAERFQTNDSITGKINITKATDKVLSGTFSFDCINIYNKTERKKVTDGRFDIAL
jgi:hypothetical protein